MPSAVMSKSASAFKPIVYKEVDDKGRVVRLSVSSEAARFIAFARRSRNEDDLVRFLDRAVFGLNLRAHLLGLGAGYRDEVLANLCLWARLEHAASIGFLVNYFRTKYTDQKVARNIFHGNVKDANRYLGLVGKRDSIRSKSLRA